jgi:hypothetical protein
VLYVQKNVALFSNKSQSPANMVRSFAFVHLIPCSNSRPGTKPTFFLILNLNWQSGPFRQLAAAFSTQSFPLAPVSQRPGLAPMLVRKIPAPFLFFWKLQ